MKKKIACIFGTRPEAIKMAPVVKALKANPDVDCRICVTAQHREMLDQVLEVFNIVPDEDLNIMRPDQTLGELTSRLVDKLDKYLSREKPDAVLVQGDTTTVLAGALAAFYNKIPIGHVEAGLRTGNIYSPWPEEANRVLTTRLARWHFAPTETSRRNLLSEGVPQQKIFVTGNTVIDALHMARVIVEKKCPEIPGLSANVMEGSKKLILITGHRRENFGPGFEQICRAIAKCAECFPEVNFVYPVHLNPHVQEPVNRIIGLAQRKNVHLIKPIGYLEFVALMNRSTFLLTDSGGVQEEAPSIGKPVLVMRDTTERPEALKAGGVLLVGANADTIFEKVSALLTNAEMFCRMSQSGSPYGDGLASQRIVDIVLKELS